MGLVDGVTTNPTLIAQEGKPFKETVLEIARTVRGPVSVEAMSSTSEEIVVESRELSKLSKNIVVKIPICAEGLKAVRQLSREGVQTNVTLVFSANQALLAAKVGASYVSSFIGRLDDAGQVGMEVVRQSLEIFKNYSYKTMVIVASIRHPLHVIEAARIGAHVATIPLKFSKG